ncbi:uncharacterized protein LOC129292955 isoform X2 [Prosopis cineraria]|uniref:uncharacterized protein LOC129292955 isoform X2 n=1 Tax=Prosopis cineraria TaxID=364024 RepID=UPI00240FE50A|nr:uncharacterized protein LOC129292955 isoform X2 [Prosopis cineraria]
MKVDRWMAATLIDFYINVVALALWVAHKESNWISSILWIILLIGLGSITSCAYIVVQFSKLSSQESSQNPMYYVLLKHPNKNGGEAAPKGKQHSFVVTLRILFTVLGSLMLGTLVYTLITDGSPFQMELLTPWMTATLIDFYINVVALGVWVAYKECSWSSALFWIVLLISFGSITTCIYIVWNLFQITCQDPVYLILVHCRGDRAENKYNRLSGAAK